MDIVAHIVSFVYKLPIYMVKLKSVTTMIRFKLITCFVNGQPPKYKKAVS